MQSRPWIPKAKTPKKQRKRKNIAPSAPPVEMSADEQQLEDELLQFAPDDTEPAAELHLDNPELEDQLLELVPDDSHEADEPDGELQSDEPQDGDLQTDAPHDELQSDAPDDNQPVIEHLPDNSPSPSRPPTPSTSDRKRRRSFSYDRSPLSDTSNEAVILVNHASNSLDSTNATTIDAMAAHVENVSLDSKRRRFDSEPPSPPQEQQPPTDRTLSPLSPYLPLVNNPPTSGFITASVGISGQKWQRGYTLADNVAIREATLREMMIRRELPPIPEGSELADHQTIPMTTIKPEGPSCLYVATDPHGRGRLLMSLQYDLHCPDRGDLRSPCMTRFSVNTANGERYDPHVGILSGDVIIVQEMMLTSVARRLSNEEIVACSQTACEEADYQPYWTVTKYLLAQRSYLVNRLAVAIRIARNGRGKAVRGTFSIEGTPATAEIAGWDCHEQLTADVPALLIDAVYPTEMRPRFSSWPREEERQQYLLDLIKNLHFDHRFPLTTFNHRTLPRSLTRSLTEFDSAASWALDSADAFAHVYRALATLEPSCATLEQEHSDARRCHGTVFRVDDDNINTTTVKLRLTNGTKGFSVKKWPTGRRIYIRPDSDVHSEPLSATITKSSLAHAELLLTAILTGHDSRVASRIWPTGATPTVLCFQQPNPVTATAKFFKYANATRTADIVNRMRNTRSERIFAKIFAAKGEAPSPPPYRHLPPRQISVDGRPLVLHQQQKEVASAFAADSIDSFLVRSGPGCGKTLSLNMASGHTLARNRNDVHLILAASNYAVVNAVESAAKIDNYRDIPITRLCSERLFRSTEAKTSFDLPRQMRGELFKTSLWRSLADDDEREHVANYREAISNVSTEDLALVDPLDERALLDALGNTALPRYRADKVFQIFFAKFKPRRIFSTLDTALAAYGPKGPLHRRASDITVIAIDEFSQVRDGSLIHALHTFPSARMVLVGDDRQLSPHAPTAVEPFAEHIVAGRIAARIVRKNLLRIIPLTRNFRAHPMLSTISSRVFYEDSLLTGVSAEERSNAAKSIVLPDPTTPFVFIHLESSQEIDRSPSWANNTERDYIVALTTVLSRRGLRSHQIAVLSLYRAQAANIRSAFDAVACLQPIFVGTADAAQGREWDVVLVSTVRSRPDGLSDFLSARERINVATSRSREATLVVYHHSIMQVPSDWQTLYDLLYAKGCVVHSNDFMDDQRH